MWRRIFLIAQKETWHILRDFRTVYMALGIPLVLLLLFGYALTMDVEDIGLLILDQDRSESSRGLVNAFERTGLFSVRAHLDSERGIETAFRTGRAKAALVVASGYERDILRGKTGRAQLLVDGADANVASIARGYAMAMGQILTLDLTVEALERQGLPARQLFTPPLRASVRTWYNPTFKSQWYLVPGLIALIMAMMTSMLMALTVAREWERGTMEQILVTPVRRMEIILGKLLPYFVIGLMQLLLIASSGVLLFDVPLKGNLLMLLVLSSVFLVGGLSQGLLISIVTRQQQLAMQLALMTSMLPALVLSGFMSPIASMPKIIQHLTYIVPARYFLVILRGLFLKDVGWAVIWPETLAMTAISFVFLLLCVKKFKMKVA